MRFWKILLAPLEDFAWRRTLARELSRRAKAGARAALREEIGFGGSTYRIGITGPPGAGKSSLIARLAGHWAACGRIGVAAIDPTSPISGGALLGDRIRMDAAAENPDLFIRSFASGGMHDGLCPNISALLDAFEQAGFDRLILETVGVGQVSYQAKTLVDCFVLVLGPDSGDTIQATKAGILEVADIYVINKADRPEARKLAGELRAIANWRGQAGGPAPPVILASAADRTGIAELAAAIAAHRETGTSGPRLEARRAYHVRALCIRLIEEVLSSGRADAATPEVAVGIIARELDREC